MLGDWRDQLVEFLICEQGTEFRSSACMRRLVQQFSSVTPVLGWEALSSSLAIQGYTVILCLKKKKKV